MPGRNLTSFLRLLAYLFLLVIGLASSGRLQAQSLKTLHNFSESEGWFPVASLALSSNILYGTTQTGGVSNYGTVFKVSIDGTGFTILRDFSGNDGERLDAGLVVAGNALYGTAVHGGSSGYGTVFTLSLDGTGFERLHDFTLASPNPLGALTNGDGDFPEARLVVSGNTLYGTAFSAGRAGVGTVFKLNTDGTGFTTLHSFTPGDGFTNEDGALPYTGLVLSGDALYGTTYLAGNEGNGTVFAIKVDGTGFRTLCSFAAGSGELDWSNIGGGNPRAELLLLGDTLFGTAEKGGRWGGGTVFRVNTDGTGFASLHDFSGTLGEGFHPFGGLVSSGSVLYGTTTSGGSRTGEGTVFAINADGTGFVTLYSFGGSDGSSPQAGLVLSGNTLYGTTRYGGTRLKGTVFSLFIQPQLTINQCGEDIILTWPTNAAGFALQSTTNLLLPVLWTTVPPEPVVIKGQNTVTNPISGTQQFYRLSQ